MENWRVKTEHELRDDTGVITTYHYPQKRVFLLWTKIMYPYYNGPDEYRFTSIEDAFDFIKRRKELEKKKITYTYANI